MHDAFSADPVCGCQDYGDFKYTINSLTVDGTRAVAKVATSNFGSPDTRTLELAKTAQGWRIYNIDGGFRGLVF